MNTAYRVGILDDLAHVRLALRVMLETQPNITIVADMDNIPALLAMPTLDLNLLLLDWELAGPHYAKSITQIRDCFPNIKILVVSVHLDSRLRALEAGADAFFHKGDSGERLQIEIKELLASAQA
jgi:DNA-binding NarL/FixJ family response regulator